MCDFRRPRLRSAIDTMELCLKMTPLSPTPGSLTLGLSFLTFENAYLHKFF